MIYPQVCLKICDKKFTNTTKDSHIKLYNPSGLIVWEKKNEEIKPDPEAIPSIFYKMIKNISIYF